MSDFNKGDFTQQGVDGHVRATLRLNEKRYVELDLTTNENARGCTISGNVHDRLNNLDYPIGAAPSGNIEITENTAEGEPLDVSQYATATVNVSGGGDTPVCCTVTIVDSEGDAESLGVDGMVLLNTDYEVINIIPSYPKTCYAFYGEGVGNNQIARLGMWQANANYSASNFSNLVNCQLVTQTDEEGVEWGINVIDKMLPSSITIDVKAFIMGGIS